MKLSHFLFTTACAVRPVLGSPVTLVTRGLDVLNGFDSALPLVTHGEHTVDRAAPTGHGEYPGYASAGLFYTTTTGKSKEGGSTTRSAASETNAQISHSVIGSIPPLPSATPWAPTSTSAAASSTSLSAAMATSRSPDQSVSRSVQEWKIVGVAVIAFSTVAAILLLSVFFDQWWGFIRDLVWKKRSKDGVEELIPDWEKASWEIRMGADRHRYPSVPPTAMTKAKLLELEYEQDSSTDNIAGLGSGFSSTRSTDRVPLPHNTQDQQASRGLGFLTPVPPSAQPDRQFPPGLPRDQRSQNMFNSRKSCISPALTDPYGGIAD